MEYGPLDISSSSPTEAPIQDGGPERHAGEGSGGGVGLEVETDVIFGLQGPDGIVWARAAAGESAAGPRRTSEQLEDAAPAATART